MSPWNMLSLSFRPFAEILHGIARNVYAHPRRAIGQFVWRRSTCVFVLSTGRCGTKTLTHLLKLSSTVYARHEPAPRLYAEALDAYLSNLMPTTRYRAIFTAARAPDIGAAFLRGQVYAETSNWLTFFSPIIRDLLPNAKFIHLVRHPRDVVRSGMRRKWY